MSADYDGDSQMVSSPSDSDPEASNRTQTPANQVTSSANTILSPPDSQHRSAATAPPPLSGQMPTSASGSAIANANGKRPLNTISNGADEDEVAAMKVEGKGAARQEFPTKTHERSGYQWNRAEDEPGYSWLNKKALDEYHRAWDGLVHRDAMVRNKYGDPFEAADKERALLNSLKQQ